MDEEYVSSLDLYGWFSKFGLLFRLQNSNGTLIKKSTLNATPV